MGSVAHVDVCANQLGQLMDCILVGTWLGTYLHGRAPICL